MIFLIEYDRPAGRLVTLRKYDASSSEDAAEARLNLELELREKQIDHEVVLLDAADEAALRKTHPRYFEDVGTLARAIIGQLAPD